MKGGSPIIFLLVLVFGMGASYLLLGQRIELLEQLRACPRPIRSILPTDPVTPAYNKEAATLLYGTELRTLSSHGTLNATCAAFQSKVPNQSARNMAWLACSTLAPQPPRDPLDQQLRARPRIHEAHEEGARQSAVGQT